MQEKLYFSPAHYGKGIKKKDKSTELPTEDNGEKNHRIRNFIFVVLFLAILVVVIIWLLRGKATTSGQYPANIRNESLTCRSETIAYDKVSNISSDNKELKISMVFAGKDTLSSANLEYILIFGSYSEAHSAEAVSHAQFNIGLQTLGYDAGKFSNKFSIIDNRLVISLHASSDKALDDTTRSYFLIDYADSGELPKTLTEYRKNYEQQGFSCVSTTD
ncbi:hypothetical protein IJ380_02810 [Candidatus Saccharibacteria bacterium]|nr:hypothetical protein [Candidatus Saccharibacteria bacterium]